MTNYIKKFYNLPLNQILRLQLFFYFKYGKGLNEKDILNFPKEIFTNGVIKKYGQQVFQMFVKFPILKKKLNDNKYFLEYVLENKLHKTIKYSIGDNALIQFISSFSEKTFIEVMNEYPELIINNINDFLLDPMIIPDFLKKNSKFLEICLKQKKFFCLFVFEKEAFTEQIIKELTEDLDFIYSSAFIPTILADNDKILKMRLDDYILNNYDIDCLIAQFEKEAFTDEVILRLSKYWQVDFDNLKSKLKILLKRNKHLFKNLNYKFLTSKYDELDINFIEKISNYSNIQNYIIELTDKELNIFSKIFNILSESEFDLAPLIESIITNKNIYSSLFNVSNEIQISEDQLKNLIYILRRPDNIYNITNIEQLTNENFQNIKLEYRKNIYNLIKNKTIELQQLKIAILEEKFGLSIEQAEFICERYCHDLVMLDSSKINTNIKLILKSINDIFKCEDINKLILYYKSLDTILVDFYTSISLEAVIRNEYIKSYNETLYRLDEEHSLTFQLHSNPELNNIKHIRDLVKNDFKFYLLDGDFNMLIHALNAYTSQDKHENFKTEWEIPILSNHGICTSYIGNDQIANAKIKSIVLGFSTLENGAIYRAANYDIGSDNSEYAISFTSPDRFYPPQEMIDNTRHTHNEIVIERRNNVGQAFKRMPDYLVLFVDDINDENEFNPELNSHYKHTLQAARDFGISIVVIDRLKYARDEYKKCEQLFNSFSNSLDVNLLDQILLKFFNNAIGCKQYNFLSKEYNTIFNQESFDRLYDSICYRIRKEKSSKQVVLFTKLISLLEAEKNKEKSEVTIELESKIATLNEIVEEIKKRQSKEIIEITTLENFEKFLLSMPLEEPPYNDGQIFYTEGMFKVDLSKAVFKKMPELAGASFLNRMKLLEVLTGKYIPISDLNDTIIFSEQEYETIRKKMSGLQRYDASEFIFSEKLYFPQLEEYLQLVDYNIKNNSIINNAINEEVKVILSNIGIFFKDFDLINTGSTSRGTNLPNDKDFDFLMKVDLTQLETIKQKLLSSLSYKQDEVVITDNRIRLKQVKINGLEELIDIDITFVERKKYFSSDMALYERLERIKKQDYEKYRLVLANIMYAKKILKESNVYKASRSDNNQAGLGGIGIENWILQNGGSLIEASEEFLEHSKGKDFLEFEQEYFINDFGKNYVSMSKHQFPYDNYIMKNMRQNGYIKMQECLKEFLQNLGNEIDKTR